ncbi:MAG: hypothetical protein V8S89_05780 [Oscillospiraceae bacterium]
MKKYKRIAHAAKIRLPSREMRSLHMADAEQIIGYCPKCGKELQIPGELPRFACMYCATKLTQAQLLADAPAPMPAVEGDAAEEFAAFSALVLACVTNFPDSYKKVTRSEFSKYSDTYLDACRPAFDHLDQCARIEPDRRTKWAELGAEDLMHQLNDWFAAQKGWNSRARQARIVDNAKFTIALFLVPMLSRGNWTISRPFAKRLHTLWMARYPKSPFTLASYDDLVSGFRKRWLCFITTAVCEAEGKPDDCAELTAFRRFRDGWLSPAARRARVDRGILRDRPGHRSASAICGRRPGPLRRAAAGLSLPLLCCSTGWRPGPLQATLHPDGPPVGAPISAVKQSKLISPGPRAIIVAKNGRNAPHKSFKEKAGLLLQPAAPLLHKEADPMKKETSTATQISPEEIQARQAPGLSAG